MSKNGKIPKTNNPWHNRIVGHADIPPDQLIASVNNFRVHPQTQAYALAGSIDTVGYIRSVTVSRRTDTVIDGHLRVILAMRNNEPTIPVEYVDLTEDEERQALLMLDPIAAMAASDKDKLNELLRQVSSDDQRVQAMLADLAEREGIIPPNFQPVGEDEQGRLDEKKKIVCPECGAEFTPRNE